MEGTWRGAAPARARCNSYELDLDHLCLSAGPITPHGSVIASPGLTPLTFGQVPAPRAWTQPEAYGTAGKRPSLSSAPPPQHSAPPQEQHLAQPSAALLASPVSARTRNQRTSSSLAHERVDTGRHWSPTSRLAETSLTSVGLDPSWNPSHLEQLRSAGLELRTVRTGGGYREKPYTQSELLHVAAALGDEVRSLRAELVRVRSLEPSIVQLRDEQEATQFAKAEVEAELASVRGEGSLRSERIVLLERGLDAEREHAALLEKRLEAQREATMRLVAVLPPPPLHEPDASEDADSPTPRVQMLTVGRASVAVGGVAAAGLAARAHVGGAEAAPGGDGSPGGQATSVSVSLGAATSTPKTSPPPKASAPSAAPPGTLSQLSDCVRRAKSWVAYAEACNKFAVSLRDGARGLRATVDRRDSQLGEARDELRGSAEEIADLHLALLEKENEVRALHAAAEARDAPTPPAPPTSPTRAGSSPRNASNVLSPTRRRASGEPPPLGWDLPGGVAAHHAELKTHALATEAQRRYEALLEELSDERYARAEESRSVDERVEAAVADATRAMSGRLATADAEAQGARKEAAALRRVAEAALDNERRAVREREAAIAIGGGHVRRGRSKSPPAKSPQRAHSPGKPPAAADEELQSIDGGSPVAPEADEGGFQSPPWSTPKVMRAGRSSSSSNGAAGSFAARRDQRRKAYESLKEEYNAVGTAW